MPTYTLRSEHVCTPFENNINLWAIHILKYVLRFVCDFSFDTLVACRSTVMPRLTITPQYDESASQWCFCNRKRCFKWVFFALRRLVPCFGNRFFALQRSKQLIIGFSKWPPGAQNGSPLCLGTDSSLHRHRKWPSYGGSSLDGEFLAHWNALTGF